MFMGSRYEGYLFKSTNIKEGINFINFCFAVEKEEFFFINTTY